VAPAAVLEAVALAVVLVEAVALAEVAVMVEAVALVTAEAGLCCPHCPPPPTTATGSIRS
jgi:hypothetical protein